MLARPDNRMPEDKLYDALMLHVHGACAGKIAVRRQVPLSHYTADFTVEGVNRNQEPVRINVECDGHEWHEKTPEQAATMKRRDGVFQSAGYQVRRFTGSQAFSTPDDCALLVRAMIATQEDRTAVQYYDRLRERVAAQKLQEKEHRRTEARQRYARHR